MALKYSFCWSQALTIVRISFAEDLRPVTSSRGKKINPLWNLIIGVALVGAVFSISEKSVGSYNNYLLLLFFSVFSLVAFNILPNTNEVRQKFIEIFHSKPISDKTFLVSRSLLILSFTFLISTCFSFFPLIAIKLNHEVSLLHIIAMYLSILLGSFSLSIIWQGVVLQLLRWLQLSVIRQFSALITVSVSLLVTVLCSGLIPVFKNADLTQSLLLKLIPSTWFASFFIYETGNDFWLLRICGIVMLLIAVVCCLIQPNKLNSDVKEKLTTLEETKTTLPLSVILLDASRKFPLINKIIPDPIAHLSKIMLTVSGRDGADKLKLMASRYILLLSFAVTFIFGSDLSLQFVLLQLGVTDILSGLNNFQYSADARASWLYIASPISKKELIKSIWISLFFKHVLLVMLLISTASLMHSASYTTVFNLLYFLLNIRLLFSLIFYIRPFYPQSNEHSTFPSSSFINSVLVAMGFCTYLLLSTLVLSYAGNYRVMFSFIHLFLIMLLDMSINKLSSGKLDAMEGLT
jgi:hypothetical protein